MASTLDSLAMFLSPYVIDSKRAAKTNWTACLCPKIKERKFKMDGICEWTGSLEGAGTNLSNIFNRMKQKHIPWIILNIREFYRCLL